MIPGGGVAWAGGGGLTRDREDGNAGDRGFDVEAGYGGFDDKPPGWGSGLRLRCLERRGIRGWPGKLGTGS